MSEFKTKPPEIDYVEDVMSSLGDWEPANPNDPDTLMLNWKELDLHLREEIGSILSMRLVKIRLLQAENERLRERAEKAILYDTSNHLNHTCIYCNYMFSDEGKCKCGRKMTRARIRELESGQRDLLYIGAKVRVSPRCKYYTDWCVGGKPMDCTVSGLQLEDDGGCNVTIRADDEGVDYDGFTLADLDRFLEEQKESQPERVKRLNRLLGEEQKDG